MHTKITDAIQECGRGHVAHVHNPRNERIVAIRQGWKKDVFESDPDSYNLDFSDPKIDLRLEKPNGNTLYNVPAKRVQQVIALFLNGTRTSEKYPTLQQFINQAQRHCVVRKVTPTRAQIEYELPTAGPVKTWRYQTTIGQYSYIGIY